MEIPWPVEVGGAAGHAILGEMEIVCCRHVPVHMAGDFRGYFTSSAHLTHPESRPGVSCQILDEARGTGCSCGYGFLDKDAAQAHVGEANRPLVSLAAARMRGTDANLAAAFLMLFMNMPLNEVDDLLEATEMDFRKDR